MKTIAALLKLSVLLAAWVSTPALAAEKSDGTGANGWVPVQHLQFTNEDIEGSTLDPDGDLIQSIPPATESSLIEIRQGFEAEIVKTMEDF